MTEYTHTRGAWEVSADTFEEDWDIVGRSVLEKVAIVPKDYDDRVGNARLISAAPELLEALEDILSLNNVTTLPKRKRIWAAAGAAIAKAKGED